MNNVLVFYGFGGVGKSALSVKLEEWVNGGVGCEHWGPSPTGFRVVTARWDLRDTEALKSPVLFYLRLRRAVVGAGVRTPLLDVGIVAMATKFNAGRGDDPDELLAGVPRLAENLLRELFPGLDDPGVGLSPERHLLSLLTTPGQVAAVDCAKLPVAVAEIMAGEADVERLCVAVKALGWLFSQDLRRLDPGQRPLPVVFVDTFEILDEKAVSGDEQVVNTALGALPDCLIVITGRKLVRWARNDPALEYAGADTWPSLARTHEGQGEPRQHLVGELDESDARELLEYYLNNIDAPLADGLCEHLARTAQLPIHIDAIVVLAKRFAQTNPGQPLTIDALGGDLKAVVERIMDRFSNDEARLLQAAAVSEQFDAPLLAAMASVSAGVAEQFLASTLVKSVDGQQYFKYHLHDEVRSLVLKAGHEVRHAWNQDDRLAAATRGVKHLGERHLVAADRDQLVERMMIHVAAYRICRSYDLMEQWVIDEFIKTPSHRRLRLLIGEVTSMKDPLDEAAALSRAMSWDATRRLPELQQFLQGCTSAELRRMAMCWAAYAHRGKRDYDVALNILRGLWNETHEIVYGSGIVITKRMMRCYREAATEYLRIGASAGKPLAGLFGAHGLPELALLHAEEYLEEAKARKGPRRWLAEINVMLMEHKGLLGILTEEDFAKLRELAEALDRNDARACYWRWRGVQGVFEKAEVEKSWVALLTVLDDSGHLATEAKRSLRLIAGMRLLACEDRTYLDRLSEHLDVTADLRDHAGEFLYEHLKGLGLVDFDLQIPPTQWIGDREVVKQRWIAIFHRLVDEARARKEAK
ncbi:MAG: hypothetical protein Q4B08_02505 [Propionibacteriaceae bacterium]|nr:hypothetical protein [Propionibacteriaceae bacterium]